MALGMSTARVACAGQVVQPLHSRHVAGAARPANPCVSASGDDGTSQAAGSIMNDLAAETRRVMQPTLAFHNQPTLAVGPNDLARELFRQCTSRSASIPGATAHSTRWNAPTAARPRPCARPRVWTVLVCIACLVVGAGAGHLVREGRAYAEGAASLGAVAHARRAVSVVPRPPRVPSAVGVTARGVVRAKDGVAASPPAPAALARRAHAKSATKPAPPPISMDALFVDFEPTFRVAQ